MSLLFGSDDPFGTQGQHWSTEPEDSESNFEDFEDTDDESPSEAGAEGVGVFERYTEVVDAFGPSSAASQRSYSDRPVHIQYGPRAITKGRRSSIGSSYYSDYTASTDSRIETRRDEHQPYNILDWLNSASFNVSSTISQDKTAGNKQEASQNLALLAQKLQINKISRARQATDERVSASRERSVATPRVYQQEVKRGVENTEIRSSQSSLPSLPVEDRMDSRTVPLEAMSAHSDMDSVQSSSADGNPEVGSSSQLAPRAPMKSRPIASDHWTAKGASDPNDLPKELLPLLIQQLGVSPKQLEQLLVSDDRSNVKVTSPEVRPDSHGRLQAADKKVPVPGASASKKHPLKSRRRTKDAPLPHDEIDWKRHLCSTLGIDRGISDADLLQTIQQHDTSQTRKSRPEAYFTILHRVLCKTDGSRNVYTHTPYFLSASSSEKHLRGRGAVSNMELYVERHHGLSFIALKSYVCCEGRKQAGADGEPTPGAECVRIISRDFSSALKRVARESKKAHLYPEFNRGAEFDAPYVWFYHDRPLFDSIVACLPSKAQQQLRCFSEEYIGTYFGEEYAVVDSQLAEKVVSSNFLPYIFLPNEVVLQRDQEAGDLYDRTFVLSDWPTFSSTVVKTDETGKAKDQKLIVSLSLSGQFWDYDGYFQSSNRTIKVQFDAIQGQTLQIQDLSVLPLAYADDTVSSNLLDRGNKFWQCRKMKFVSYTGWDYSHDQHFVDARFMVDMQTYKKMHLDSVLKGRKEDRADNAKDDLGPEVMARDEPPNHPFPLLLPPNIYGFNIQEKKWMNLLVANTSEVMWNNEAFDTLVVDDETKELIMALVTNKIEIAKSTDLISGKGNGLIVLLHGGPGTGKTLTAESVAEYARKPLYRITCGDIGTNPEDVEKYLASVLYLGKTWDCVVLLDEAEVFLQTRDLEDLHRNALVSVFLRVLEYYEGILILTSNRVATFDEAFKSRIQLALHYEALGKPQRRLVWQNFIHRLESFEGKGKWKATGAAAAGGSSGGGGAAVGGDTAAADKVDTADLHRHIDKLASFDMNGRQIRNAVTTARQLAMFKKKAMDYSVLEHVINVSNRFDKYLKQVKEDLSDEEIARGMQVR